MIFFLVTILVVWDLSFTGYLLSLDMVFTNELNILENFYGAKKSPSTNLMFILFTFFLNLAFPIWIIQKFLIFCLIFFSGVFPYKLCPSKNKLGKVFSGLIYMLNPFIFVRFLAGHIFLLTGYLILPLLLKTFMDFFKEPDLKETIKLTFLLTLISLVNHFIPIMFSILISFLIMNFLNKNKRNLIKYSIIIFTLYILINSFWIIPTLLDSNTTLRSFQNFIGPEDISLFSPKPSFNFNTLFNLASMHGFWRQGYDYAKFHIPFWPLLYGIILFLTVHGFLILNKDPKYKLYARALAVIAVVSLILATGTTHPFFSKIFKFLFDYVPFFKGCREPHKFVALLCLAYAFFGGVGLGDFVKQFKESKKNIPKVLLALFIVISLLTPIIYSYTMFFGFHGQLESVDYPKTWYETDEYLNKDQDNFNVLFLPWHLYMTFRFNPKQRIANPADKFFTKPVIWGDNIEAGGIYSQSTNPVSKYIEFLLSKRQEYNNFGELVKPLNVKYVILAKETDWQNYQFLYNQTDLELVVDNEDLLIFKNNQETSPVYETNTLLTKDDWKSLLDNYTFELDPIPVEKRSPIKYILQENPDKQYLVFAEKFSEGWRYGNQQPQKYLDTVNVFETSEENTIYYHRFRYYLIGYIISGTTFLILIGYLIYDWKKDFFKRIEIKVTSR